MSTMKISKINYLFLLPCCFCLITGISQQAWSATKIVDDKSIVLISLFSSPKLETLKTLIQSGLPTKNSPHLFTTGIKINKGQEEDLVTILRGRFNSNMELDLSIIDSEADNSESVSSNSGLSVIMDSPIFCAETEDSNLLNAKLAVDFFLPFDSEINALDADLNWKQKNLDKISNLLTNMISSCQFEASQIQLVGKDNASLTTLSIKDPQTQEILLIGFLWK